MPIWVQIASLLVTAFVAYQAAKARTDTAMKNTDAKIEKMGAELANFRLEVAKEYATKSGLDGGMNRIVAELQGLRVDTKEGFQTMRTEYNRGLDKLGDRIEKMEEHVFKKGGS